MSNNHITSQCGEDVTVDRGLTPTTDLSYSQSNSLPLVLFVSCWLAGWERGGRQSAEESAEESESRTTEN